MIRFTTPTCKRVHAAQAFEPVNGCNVDRIRSLCNHVGWHYADAVHFDHVSTITCHHCREKIRHHINTLKRAIEDGDLF